MVPSQAIFPSNRNAARCAIFRALSMSWVMVRAVVRLILNEATISEPMIVVRIGSSPAVGASSNSSSGLQARARARATRFCIPPESSAGRDRQHRSPIRLSPASRSRCRALRRLPGGRRSEAQRRHFARPAVSSRGHRSGNTTPIFRISDERSALEMPIVSRPPISIDPASGERRPSMHFISTVLPLPEAPRRTRLLPSLISRSTPDRTVCWPKDFHRPRMRTTTGACRVCVTELPPRNQARARTSGMWRGASVPTLIDYLP